MAGPLSGVGGHIDQGGVVIGCLRTWTLSLTAALAEAICSASSGATLRAAGNLDWSGSYTAYGHTPAVDPGDSFTLNAAIAGVAAASIGLEGAAICDSWTVEVDIEGGAVIGHTVNFSANGALGYGASGVLAVDDDDSLPAPHPGNLCKVQIAEASPYDASHANILDVRTWSLTVTADNKSFVSSETAGQTKRSAGNIDAKVAIGLYAQDDIGYDSLPTANAIVGLRLFVTATLYWELAYAMVEEVGDQGADVEAGALAGGSLSLGNMAYADISGTFTEGHIKNPAGADIWP